MKKVRDHSGVRNPHYNHPHSDSAKAAISAKQRQRYEMLRQIVDKKTVSEERVREIVRETIADYIKNNASPVARSIFFSSSFCSNLAKSPS